MSGLVGRAELRQIVAAAVASETGIALVDLNDSEPFASLGVESVLAVAIVRRLEESVGELSKTLLFEFQTLGALVDHLAAEFGAPSMRSEPVAPQALRPVASVDRAYARVESSEAPAPTRPPAGDQPAGVAHAPGALQDRDAIAIIGISGRFPGAGDLDAFWENLAAGRDCITEVPGRLWDWNEYWDPEPGVPGKSYSKWGGFLEDSDRFDPLFFNISNLQAESMDPQERVFLETVHHTLEDAAYTRETLKGRRVGLYVAAMWGSYQHYGVDDAGTDSSFSSIANRASYFFGLTGPSVALDTTCSGSLTTLHLACESIRSGESDLAIAGGVNITSHPQKYLVLSRLGFAAPDGRCRSFGADAGGYVPGDGSGAVLLKPLAAAIADGDRIHAVIRASAINHGGRSSGFTVPSADAQAELIEAALDRAGVDPRMIGYVEAHAPGTALGDPIEVRGLTKAFRKRTDARGFCPVGSVKSNIGHLESAAGIASLAKVVLQLRHRQIAPSIHAERLNPNIDFESTPFYVNRALAPWHAPAIETQGPTVNAPRRAGISAFGAGGSNAHVVVEEYAAPAAATSPAPEQLVVLSAKTEERLREVALRLRTWLADRLAPPSPMHDPVAGESTEARILDCVSRATRIRATLLDAEDRIGSLLPDAAGLDRLAQLLGDAFGRRIEGGALSALSIADLGQWASNPAGDSGEADAALLEQIAYTLQVGRDAMERRVALLVRSTADLAERLDAFVAGDPLTASWTGTAAVATGSGEDEQRLIRQLAGERRYERLAKLWTEGVHIPWAAMYPQRPSRIALPLYPFERARCWAKPQRLEKSPAGVSFVTREEDVFAAAQRLCYRPRWSPAAALRPAPDPTRGRATVLVYPAGAAPLAEALKQMLPDGAWEIVLGTRTELTGRRRWEVDPSDARAVAACLGFVEDLGTIWFLGGCATGDTTTAFDRLEAEGAFTLFRIAQWLAARTDEAPVRLRILTAGGVAIDAVERVQPHAATVRGMARAIAREHREVQCDLIDLPLGSGAAGEDLQGALRLAIDGIDGVPEFAIRGSRAYASCLEPFDPVRPAAPVFKRGGTYVLVGGAGTLGRRISRALAERAGARLVWLGRRAPDTEIASEQASIEKLGGSLAYRAADAADPAALAAAFDEIERSHGRIDGVLHLAKTHEIVRVCDLAEESLRGILDSKTRTSVALETALAGRSLDFVALFSSSEAHVGSVGWSGYASACAFQDALALEWARRASYPVVAVNWGYWEGVDEDVGAMLAAKGIRQLGVDTGLAILETALAARTGQLAALDVDAAVLERMGFVPRADGPASAAPAVVAQPRPEPASDRPAPSAGERKEFDFRTFDPATFDPDSFNPDSFPSGDELPSPAALAETLAGLVSDVLRIDRARIERDADLITYGIDSLTVIALHKTVEARTGTLPATLFITAKTIDAVAEELLYRYPVAACALAGGPATVARATGSMRRLGAASPGTERAYLDSYGARFHDGSLAQEAARAEPQRLTPEASVRRGLDHLLVDTPSAPGLELIAAGEGAPVLLLPAVGLTAPTWRHQIASPLAEKMRLNVAHVPGYGLTAPISDCTSNGITRAVRDLIDLVVPDRPVHVVASCLGSVTGMNLARMFPERVASLTLVGAFHDTSDMSVADPARLTTDELMALLNGAVDRIRDDFAAVVPPPTGPDETPDQQLEMLLGALCANALVALRYLTEMLTLPVLDWLPQIRVPTQCIYGTNDLIVGTHHSHTIAAGIAGARLVAIEGAGHFPYLTHSAQFNPLIEAFIAEIEPRARQAVAEAQP